MGRALTIVEIGQRIDILVRSIDAKLRENIDPDTRAADLKQLRSTLHRYQRMRRNYWKKTGYLNDGLR